VELNSDEVVHMTASGQYLLTGDLIELRPSQNSDGRPVAVNHTERFRSGKRVRLLDGLVPEQLITYKAKGDEVGQVYVFTDTDCVYCRKFHAEVDKMNSLGVTVSYLAWPRAGMDSTVGQKMIDIWCAKDRHSQMDRAKRGARVEKLSDDERSKSCVSTVESQLKLGAQLGVRGTPAVFVSTGQQVGGYLKADQLYERVKAVSSE
jgi:thiol:disulfide interchange protein DsbC